MISGAVEVIRLAFLVGLPLFGVAILLYFLYELVFSPSHEE